MKRFIEGEDRTQVTLLPECLDDFVVEDNPVRVIDVFIDELDLSGLGFEGVAPADTGRPAYHPAMLLKIYVYGYLNRLQSSRRPSAPFSAGLCPVRGPCHSPLAQTTELTPTSIPYLRTTGSQRAPRYRS